VYSGTVGADGLDGVDDDGLVLLSLLPLLNSTISTTTPIIPKQPSKGKADFFCIAAPHFPQNWLAAQFDALHFGHHVPCGCAWAALIGLLPGTNSWPQPQY
jgi:hypothetical protein